jgi:hypothetical protein
MNSAAEALVIILSVALAFFLVLGIVLMIYLIVLTRQIRRVTNSAEKTVENLGSVVSGVSKVITPMYIAEMVGKFVKKTKKSKKED